MASLIHELENNEALLLMYHASELPAEDRLEVEQMLAGDAHLRAELAELDLAYAQSMGALAILDSDRTAIPAENHAIRQASRAMKQWQVDRLVRQPAIAPDARKRVPGWAYPIGIAAMLLIGSLIWWGGQSDQLPASKTFAVAEQPADDAKTLLLENSFVGVANPQDSGITGAENQAADLLVARSNNDAMASSIFLTDGNP